MTHDERKVARVDNGPRVTLAQRLAREVSGLLVEYGVQVPVETRQELEERFQGILQEDGGGGP